MDMHFLYYLMEYVTIWSNTLQFNRVNILLGGLIFHFVESFFFSVHFCLK